MDGALGEGEVGGGGGLAMELLGGIVTFDVTVGGAEGRGDENELL